MGTTQPAVQRIGTGASIDVIRAKCRSVRDTGSTPTLDAAFAYRPGQTVLVMGEAHESWRIQRLVVDASGLSYVLVQSLPRRGTRMRVVPAPRVVLKQSPEVPRNIAFDDTPTLA